jgi:hypothetical protein
MGPTVFGTADVTVVFVNCCDVGASALGAGKEGFGTLTIGNGVTEAEASATLEESGAILKGADCSLATKEVGGRAFHELKAVPIGVIKGEYYAGMYFTGEVFFAAEPSGFGKDSATCTNSVFHEFSAEGSGGDGVRVSISDNWNPSQYYLSVALSGGCATVRTEWSEKNIVVLGNCVKRRSTF